MHFCTYVWECMAGIYPYGPGEARWRRQPHRRWQLWGQCPAQAQPSRCPGAPAWRSRSLARYACYPSLQYKSTSTVRHDSSARNVCDIWQLHCHEVTAKLLNKSSCWQAGRRPCPCAAYPCTYAEQCTVRQAAADAPAPPGRHCLRSGRWHMLQQGRPPGRACMGCVASAVQGTVTRSCRAYARSTRSGSRPSSASRLSSRLASTRLPPDSDTRRSLARSPAALLMKRCSSLRPSRVELLD